MEKTSVSKLLPLILPPLLSVLIAGAGFYFSKVTARETAKDEFKSALGQEIVAERIKHYPELFELTYQLSKYYPECLDKNEAILLGQTTNTWLYGAGGMYGSATTRERVAWLRSELINVKLADTTDGVQPNSKGSPCENERMQFASGGDQIETSQVSQILPIDLSMAKKARTCVIHALRADLNLLGDLGNDNKHNAPLVGEGLNQSSNSQTAVACCRDPSNQDPKLKYVPKCPNSIG